MSFAELVIFVDGVGYSLAARSRDEMFIKKQCILWYLLYNLSTLQLTTLQFYNSFHDFSYEILSQLILLFSTN